MTATERRRLLGGTALASAIVKAPAIPVVFGPAPRLPANVETRLTVDADFAAGRIRVIALPDGMTPAEFVGKMRR